MNQTFFYLEYFLLVIITDLFFCLNVAKARLAPRARKRANSMRKAKQTALFSSCGRKILNTARAKRAQRAVKVTRIWYCYFRGVIGSNGFNGMLTNAHFFNLLKLLLLFTKHRPVPCLKCDFRTCPLMGGTLTELPPVDLYEGTFACGYEIHPETGREFTRCVFIPSEKAFCLDYYP